MRDLLWSGIYTGRVLSRRIPDLRASYLVEPDLAPALAVDRPREDVGDAVRAGEHGAPLSNACLIAPAPQ
jgi:hypothetical protein